MSQLSTSWTVPSSIVQLEKAREYLQHRLKHAIEQLKDAGPTADPTFIAVQQNFIEGNLERIEKQLLRARISSSPMRDTIGIGSIIRIQRGNDIREVMLIPETGSDPNIEYVTVGSALGKALIGHHENDVVEIRTELGVHNYGVLRIA